MWNCNTHFSMCSFIRSRFSHCDWLRRKEKTKTKQKSSLHSVLVCLFVYFLFLFLGWGKMSPGYELIIRIPVKFEQWDYYAYLQFLFLLLMNGHCFMHFLWFTVFYRCKYNAICIFKVRPGFLLCYTRKYLS